MHASRICAGQHTVLGAGCTDDTAIPLSTMVPVLRVCVRARAQAVTFLVIHQKHKKSLEEITNDLCPVLSVQQLYRISTMYWDDRYNTETVSHEVRACFGSRTATSCEPAPLYPHVTGLVVLTASAKSCWY